MKLKHPKWEATHADLNGLVDCNALSIDTYRDVLNGETVILPDTNSPTKYVRVSLKKEPMTWAGMPVVSLNEAFKERVHGHEINASLPPGLASWLPGPDFLEKLNAPLAPLQPKPSKSSICPCGISRSDCEYHR